MEQTLRVIAAPGTQCPREGKPREYITDAEAVTVPATTYYKRLVDDGSLLLETETTTKKKEVKADGK